MGVSGVAWATFLCQGVSCMLAMVVILKRLASIRTEEKPALYSFSLLKKTAVIAVPSMFQQSFISLGNIVIQSVINGFGPGVIAGYSAAVKLNNMVITSFTTLGNGVSNYTAQNLGAGKKDRIRAGFGAGIRLVWMLCIPIVFVYLLFGKMLVGFFMDAPTDAALSSGIWFLRIVAPFYFVISVKLVADGILRGAGQMQKFMISTFTDLLLRVVLTSVLAGLMGPVGIWCAWPVGWSIGMILSVIFYFMGK